jgi:hypothetical protein
VQDSQTYRFLQGNSKAVTPRGRNADAGRIRLNEANMASFR